MVIGALTGEAVPSFVGVAPCRGVISAQIPRKVDRDVAAESELFQNLFADGGGVADDVLTERKFPALRDCTFNHLVGRLAARV